MCKISGETDNGANGTYCGIDTLDIISTMKRRGPDRNGTAFCGNAALLHSRRARRLSEPGSPERSAHDRSADNRVFFAAKLLVENIRDYHKNIAQ